ncbi:MAG: flagellar protein FliS [Parcubacteria group bacterium LiPW_41]|nr:MAG: flagellar protein FliS [Parcubacteria group bacterium LiPW_41]
MDTNLLSKYIENTTPEQLIIKVYDFAILNCQKRNAQKANESLQVLINALSFQDPTTKEISIGLFRLYRYCQDQVKEGKYETAEKVLTELKESWEVALKKNGL